MRLLKGTCQGSHSLSSQGQTKTTRLALPWIPATSPCLDPNSTLTALDTLPGPHPRSTPDTPRASRRGNTRVTSSPPLRWADGVSTGALGSDRPRILSGKLTSYVTWALKGNNWASVSSSTKLYLRAKWDIMHLKGLAKCRAHMCSIIVPTMSSNKITTWFTKGHKEPFWVMEVFCILTAVVISKHMKREYFAICKLHLNSLIFK